MDCRDARRAMHDYLDGTLEAGRLQALKHHLSGCPACESHLDRLEMTEAMLFAVPAPDAPEDMTDRVMAALPKPSRKTVFVQWLKRHPAAAVAVIFLLMMTGSITTLWERDATLSVKGNDLDDVVIEGDLIIVPAGRIVDGDLTVENGRLQVEGEIRGNVTVIDGSVNLASTAQIAGQVTSINQAIDHFWFKIKSFFAGFSGNRQLTAKIALLQTGQSFFHSYSIFLQYLGSSPHVYKPPDLCYHVVNWTWGKRPCSICCPKSN